MKEQETKYLLPLNLQLFADDDDDDDDDDNTEPKKKPAKKEDAPAWAKSLQQSMETLAKNLNTKPEAKPGEKTQEVKVPAPAAPPEDKKQEESKESPSSPEEKKKGKSFLEWFLG